MNGVEHPSARLAHHPLPSAYAAVSLAGWLLALVVLSGCAPKLIRKAYPPPPDQLGVDTVCSPTMTNKECDVAHEEALRAVCTGAEHGRRMPTGEDYAGAIFVSDIDDTLRDTSWTALLFHNQQPPIDGTTVLLCEVAKLGVPITYLSAGATDIRDQNLMFLSQLPPGILIDNPTFTVFTSDQAEAQGQFKLHILQQLEQMYPRAKFFGIGDDKYGDAVAYTEGNATAYIHHVASDPHFPAVFSGVLFQTYSTELRHRILDDLHKDGQGAPYAGSAVEANPTFPTLGN